MTKIRVATSFPTRTNLYKLILAMITLAALFAGPARAQHMDRVDRGTALGMFDQIAGDIQKHYYDQNLHGMDWNAKVLATRAKIRAESSMNMALADISAALESLDDSHTFFIPPARLQRHDYGFRTEMVGDHCYVSRVRPGSDAETKGLKRGDEVQSLEGSIPTRGTLAELNYRYTVLHPQTGLRLAINIPAGPPREFHVMAEYEDFNRVAYVDSSGVDAAVWDGIRSAEDEAERMRPRLAELSDALLIVKLPVFSFEPWEVDKITKKARKHSALILDLRDNPGGTVTSLELLVGGLFDHNVRIADRLGRKEMKPVEAKSMGRRGFDGKLVVLVNSKSASAAELLARLVQLQKRGLVVGDCTSGHVMEAKHHYYKVGADIFVQYGVSLTEADLRMSDGKSLEHSGVIPDEIVLPTAHDMANDRDPILARAAALVGVTLSPEDAGKILPYTWPK